MSRIKFIWSTASESIRNGWYNSDRLSHSSRLAKPEITAVDRFWFRRWSSHEPNQLHKLIECISNVFWSPEYAQKYKLCVSTSKWRVSLVWEDWADKCSLHFPGFACKLAVSLVTGIKINAHSITLVCFCLNSEARGWRHDSGKTQTNKLEWWMILKISLRAKAGVCETLVKRKLRLHSLYFPQNSLTLTESRGEFSDLHCIFRLRALRWLRVNIVVYHVYGSSARISAARNALFSPIEFSSPGIKTGVWINSAALN